MNVAAILKWKGRAVTTARPDTAVLAITEKLTARKIGTVVIVGDNGLVDGIISERDIIRAVAEHGAAALQMPVSRFMTRQVQTCQEINPIDEIMEIMTRERFRHMPVLEDGALVGIISIGDVVKHHVAEVEMEVSAMRNYLATG